MTQTNNKGAPVPVLIPVGPGDKYDGVANFFGKFDQRVAIVGPEHLKSESKRFIAATQLRDAHESGDAFSIHAALDSFYASEPRIAEVWKRAPVERVAPSNLPTEFTEHMARARLVLWWHFKRKRFQPAVYCPTLRVAQYVLAALRDLRACPFCDKLFVPYRPDQFYCSIHHRESFRKRRQRAKGAR